jgi:hypothetical protein
LTLILTGKTMGGTVGRTPALAPIEQACCWCVVTAGHRWPRVSGQPPGVNCPRGSHLSRPRPDGLRSAAPFTGAPGSPRPSSHPCTSCDQSGSAHRRCALEKSSVEKAVTRPGTSPPTFCSVDSRTGVRSRSGRSVTSSSSLPVVRVGPGYAGVVHPCGSQRGSQSPTALAARVVAVRISSSWTNVVG